MLIILSGMETIHKKFFARKILGAMNTWECEGYTIDLSGNLARIRDADGNVVLTENDRNAQPFDKMAEVLAKMSEVEAQLINSIKVNHFNNVFCDPWADYGLIPEQESLSSTFEGRSYRHPHTYADVLANYKNRQWENFVITGAFSAGFIKKIRKSLGAKNVMVFNITRNPSTCHQLNLKAEDEYADPLKDHTPLSDRMKMHNSMCNAAILKDVTGVQTIKFEDIIDNGGFSIDDVWVGVPDGYDSYNGILTQWEYNNVIPLRLVDDVGRFNVENIDFHLLHNIEDDESGEIHIRWFEHTIDAVNAVFGTTLTEADVKVVPSNIFEALGYQPLSYEDIIRARQPETV